MLTATQQRRVWLVADIPQARVPAHDDNPPVADDQGRQWTYSAEDGKYHTADNRHHASWDELHDRTDLTEVVR